MLNENEYRVNFKQIDNDVIKTLVSPEARQVTPLVSAIYLGLISSPQECWEREGVLHFVGEDREGESLTAWEQMREITGVANSTLSKALDWMHRTGVIGYDARSNGAGIRIFFNRATSSIRSKPTQKNLHLVPTPSEMSPTPSGGVGFKESKLERKLDKNIVPREDARDEIQPANGITTTPVPSVERKATNPNLRLVSAEPPRSLDGKFLATLTREIAATLKPEIAAAVKRETDKNREWFLNHGLPKATRVAQRETYDLLRAHGLIAQKNHNSAAIGRNLPTAEQGREGKKEEQGIADYLAESSAILAEAAIDAGAAGRGSISAVCQAAVTELSELRDQILTGERLGIDETEKRLSTIEEQILDALWDMTGPDERMELLRSSRADLQSYAGRMEDDVFEETIRRRARGELRRRHRIPRLGLFYL
jgi:hypothetical protein